MVTDFLVSNLVLVCMNFNTESIDIINEKIGPSERNLWPEKWYTVGTCFKNPLTGGTSRVLAHCSTHLLPIVIIETSFDTILTIAWTIEIITVTLHDKVRYQNWPVLRTRMFV